jgi:two-component system OmpR family sensor kinase
LLRRVTTNLVANAIAHTPKGSPIELAVGTAPDPDGTTWVVFEVSDHGPGIPPESRDKVFERFYRLDESRSRDSGGTGLGLAVVASIVRAHSGRVHIDETPGGGACIRIYLPAEPLQ